MIIPPATRIHPALRLFWCLFLIGGVALGGEMRTWTSSSGSTVEAELVEILGDMVILKTVDGVTKRILLSKLSPEDQKAARTQSERKADAPAAAKPLAANAAKPKDGGIRQMGSVTVAGLKFDRVQSAHFIALGCNTDPRILARNAETVWDETAVILGDFKDMWVDGETPVKMAVFSVATTRDYMAFQKWYAEQLRKDGDDEEADAVEFMWKHTGAYSLKLNEYTMEMTGATTPMSKIINDENNRNLNQPVTPFRTHVMACRLMDFYCKGSISEPFWLESGYGYHTEIRLCRRTDTHKLDYNKYGTDGDDQYKPGGDEEYKSGGDGGQGAAGGGRGRAMPISVNYGKHFKDGAKWVQIVKDMMRTKKPDVPKGDIGKVMDATISNLTPELCGYVFAFTRFLLSDPINYPKYDKLMKQAAKSGGTITPRDIADAYGYKDEAALQEAWHEFMKGNDFR